MHTSWWYLLDGAQHGPVSSDALQALIHQQALTADALVWRAEFADWRRIADVPELTRMLPAYSAVNAPVETDDWWYAQDGASHGPVDSDTLRALLRQGQLNEASLVWTTALPDWVPAAELPMLRTGLTPAAAETPVTFEAPAMMAAAPSTALPVQPTMAFNTAGPWRRLFARLIDIYLLLIPVAFFSAFLLSSYFLPFALWIQKPGAATLYTWLLLPVVMLLEALIHAAFGNTIGKVLFGVRVTSNGVDRLSGGSYLKRQLRVYWYGLATGFPLIQLIAMIRQYLHCKKDGQTRYDAGQSIVIRTERGVFRSVFAALLLILLLFTMVVLNSLPALANAASCRNPTPPCPPKPPPP